MGINMSIESGVFLFQGFKNTRVQEYQMSGSSLIIMSSFRKSDNHDYAM